MVSDVVIAFNKTTPVTSRYQPSDLGSLAFTHTDTPHQTFATKDAFTFNKFPRSEQAIFSDPEIARKQACSCSRIDQVAPTKRPSWNSTVPPTLVMPLTERRASVVQGEFLLHKTLPIQARDDLSRGKDVTDSHLSSEVRACPSSLWPRPCPRSRRLAYG